MNSCAVLTLYLLILPSINILIEMTTMNSSNRVNKLCDGVSRPNSVPITVPITPGIAKDTLCLCLHIPFFYGITYLQ